MSARLTLSRDGRLFQLTSRTPAPALPEEYHEETYVFDEAEAKRVHLLLGLMLTHGLNRVDL